MPKGGTLVKKKWQIPLWRFKKQYNTDNESLALRVLTTKTSVNEITNLEEVLDTADLPQNIA
jgi:hypothetical protein